MHYFQFLFNEGGMLTTVPSEFTAPSLFGKVTWDYYPDTGQPRQCTIYYPSSNHASTSRILMQSSFLNKPRGYRGLPEYASTVGQLPDGSDFQCNRLAYGLYEEWIWYPGSHRSKTEEHSLYDWKPEAGTEEAHWILLSKERLDEKGKQTLWEKIVDIGQRVDGRVAERCLWGFRDKDGIERRFSIDICNLPTESDYRKGSPKPFREVSFECGTPTVWVNDAQGNHVLSFVYKHYIQDHPPCITPLVSQIIVSVWRNGEPVWDQIYDLDKRISQPDAKPPKLVYVLTGVDVLARYGKEKAYLRVRMHNGGKSVHTITLSCNRECNQAEHQAYEDTVFPEYAERQSLSQTSLPNKTRTVWAFREDGSMEYVSQFDGANHLVKVTTIAGQLGKAAEAPQTRQDVDGDLDPQWFLADFSDQPLPPSAMELPDLPEVDPALLKQCPPVDPEWFKAVEIPPEPSTPEIPPH